MGGLYLCYNQVERFLICYINVTFRSNFVYRFVFMLNLGSIFVYTFVFMLNLGSIFVYKFVFMLNLGSGTMKRYRCSLNVAQSSRGPKVYVTM